MSNLNHIVENLCRSRAEAFEAMRARKGGGVKGEKYAEIVAEAANAIVAVQVCAMGMPMTDELDKRLKHAVICIMIYGAQEAGLHNAISFAQINDEKFIDEFTTDVKNVVRYMLKVAKAEEM